MQPKFEFYEIVRIESPLPRFRSLTNREGAVLGRSQDETGEWGYVVFLYDVNQTWDLPETALVSTGRRDSPDTFYDGTTIRVTVDPDTGTGTQVSDCA